jgi:hypothetical protein
VAGTQTPHHRSHQRAFEIASNPNAPNPRCPRPSCRKTLHTLRALYYRPHTRSIRQPNLPSPSIHGLFRPKPPSHRSTTDLCYGLPSLKTTACQIKLRFRNQTEISQYCAVHTTVPPRFCVASMSRIIFLVAVRCSLYPFVSHSLSFPFIIRVSLILPVIMYACAQKDIQ